MPAVDDDLPTTPRHPIRVVAERTGINPATLRAWERRHRAIAPRRSQGSQRLYSDADIERLRLIGQLAADGYALGDLARRATPALARLLKPANGDVAARAPGAEHGAANGAAGTVEAQRRFSAESAVARLLADIRTLDAAALRGTLTRAVFEIGPLPALDFVFAPFLRDVGQEWACGTLSVAHEHLASTAVRDVLGWLLQNATYERNAPVVVATTLRDEHHEFGAMMAAVVASVAGWRVVYLGANMPAGELVRVAKEAKARVVFASIAHRHADPATMRQELSTLRAGLPSGVSIIVGGAGAEDHRLTLRKTNIDLIESRPALRAALGAIWTRTA